MASRNRRCRCALAGPTEVRGSPQIFLSRLEGRNPMSYSVTPRWNRAHAAWWSGIAITLLRIGTANAAPTPSCPDTDTGITLSPGFCASVFADNIGHARYLVVALSGVVYVNT